MPTTTTSPTRQVTKAATAKPHAATAPSKKRRVIRRRGRARDEPDSDEDFVREVTTDSESEDDDLSSLDSATDDSDTEPASEDAPPRDRTHLPTPRNSKSPESVLKEETNGGVESFFAPSGDWSEMVADEKANGPSSLPIIDFADFSGQPIAPKAAQRKNKKAPKSNRQSESRATTVPPEPEAKGDAGANIPDHIPSQSKQPTSHHARTSSQSARLAYQHKLETDPSFVPTIGNFWGHDDRLIDTELRSLSGWWRGRGRGRGRGFAMRGRGGPFSQSRVTHEGEGDAPAKEIDVPPIERAWTHDGFEELKRKEEAHRAEALAARNAQDSPKRGGFVSGRAGFSSGRGRGGFMRGGFAPAGMSYNPHGRIRYAVKPELMWTKQHEAFLFFETTLKPRQGQGQGIRVRLPGQKTQIVRGQTTLWPAPKASTPKYLGEGSDVGEKQFVVRLPQRSGKDRVIDNEDSAEETPLDEVFTVRPHLAAAVRPPAPVETAQVSVPPSLPTPVTPEAVVPAVPEAAKTQLEQLALEPQPSDPERLAKTEQAVLKQVPQDATGAQVIEGASSERPALSTLQTAFSPPQPPVQPSPAYGSPYGYHPALPPGVGMDPHGMPYELATGRPVYFHNPAMYNPRPVMPSHYNQGVQFVPGHMQHPSAVSPDFLAQGPSHTPPINSFIDPATGTPIFSFPRQTSRIEIRAPTEESERAAKSHTRSYSNLRTAAPTFQPTRSVDTSSSNGYYQQSAHPEGAASPYEDANGRLLMEDASQAGISGMMAYPAYQQTYYYPEPYGYPQYMDMSQGGQYDMYNMENPPQGTVYY